jgi:hypothetical protein
LLMTSFMDAIMCRSTIECTSTFIVRFVTKAMLVSGTCLSSYTGALTTS